MLAEIIFFICRIFHTTDIFDGMAEKEDFYEEEEN